MDQSRMAAVLAAIDTATREYKLCPNRIWEVGSRLENWETEFPGLLRDHQVAFSNAFSHQDHSACTFDFCEFSTRNFTAVRQHHVYPFCETFCSRVRGLFKQEELTNAFKKGARLSAWSLDGRSLVEHPRPFMAISHVWSDGTGMGAWSVGEVHGCLYRYFRELSERFQCEGIWWDTICIPPDKAARATALNIMQYNYQYARVTVVHDIFLKSLAWTTPEAACFTIVMSPWFSRGWTALELAMSRKVNIIFRDCIKDLDEDILKSVALHNAAAKSISNLRAPVIDVEDFLTVLGPRHTSWPKDQANIAGLLAGIDIPSGSSTIDAFQSNIYQDVLVKTGRISHGHLFHKSATMSGGFGWCATSLLQLPHAPGIPELSILTSGEVFGEWKVITINEIPLGSYRWGASHPLIEARVQLALQFKTKHVVLLRPHEASSSSGVLVKLWKIPSTGAELSFKCQYIGPIFFSSTTFPNATTQAVIIGDPEDCEELGEREDAWLLLRNQQPRTTSPYLTTQETRMHHTVLFDLQNKTHWSKLHHAVWTCDLTGVRDYKGDVNLRDDLGQCAIHLAAERGNEVIMKHLLERGANTILQDSDGQTALHWAARGGSVNVLALLLRRTECKDNIDGRDGQGQTALHIAAEYGNAEAVKRLLVAGADPNIQRDTDGQTPLHRSILEGSGETTQSLLDGLNGVGADITLRDKFGRSGLDAAAQRGNISLSQMILSHGRHRYEPYEEIGFVRSAAQGGNMKVIRYLLNHFHLKPADLTRKDKEGRTLLHFAAQGSKEAIEFLLNEGLSITETDSLGQTPLHSAAYTDRPEAIKMLISAGTDRDAQTARGQTALHIAAREDNTASAWVLLDSGLDTETKDSIGRTAMHIAATAGHVAIVDVLVQKRANKSARDLRGSTPLHLATIKAYPAIVNLLMEHAIDTEAVNGDGETALHLAARLNASEMARILLRGGASGNATTPQGQTALHLAAMEGKIEVVQTLVREGLNIRARDLYQNTALHVAASCGRGDVATTLMKLGADKNAINKDHETPLHLAAGLGYGETLVALIQGGADIDGPKDHDTALHKAAAGDHWAEVATLLDHGASIEAMNGRDNTVLYLASISGCTRTVKVLIERGANIDTKDWDGETATHAALRCHRPEVAEVLIKHGARINLEYLEMTNLMLAASNGFTDTVRLLLARDAETHRRPHVSHNRETALDFAIKAGYEDTQLALIEDSSPSQLASSVPAGSVALLNSISNGYVRTAMALITRDINIDASVGDITTLHAASEEGHLSIVKALLEKKVKIDEMDTLGYTALSIAADCGHSEIVATLLDAGAGMNIMDVYGGTALSRATKAGATAVIAQLTKRGGGNA